MALKLTVNAGEHDREHCPVTATVRAPGTAPDQLRLTTACCGQAVPCRIEPEGEGLRLSWILDALPAGRDKTYILAQGPPENTGGVELKNDGDGRVQVLLDGVPFTAFHHDHRWARPFLFPLAGPFGSPVTRSYPVVEGVPGETTDHPHHKSFWVAWGDVNGTDNWSENRERGHATVRVRTIRETASGPACGRIGVTCDWLSEKGRKVLEEDRDMVFYATPPALRIVDLTVTFRATEGPVRFGDTKEGGICAIRVASSMDASGRGTIVNSFGGKNEAETWGKRAQWCDYSGPVDGRTVGIAICDHPANLRHPTYWHVRNYGLMTANPFGISHFSGDKTRDGGYRLAAGAALTFRYRVLIHAGDSRAASIAERYHDFVTPPTVAIG
jgi:hypothetical protein